LVDLTKGERRGPPQDSKPLKEKVRLPFFFFFGGTVVGIQGFALAKRRSTACATPLVQDFHSLHFVFLPSLPQVSLRMPGLGVVTCTPEQEEETHALTSG
jgi:hypothetical protein